MPETWTADDLVLTEHLVREVEYLDGAYAVAASEGGNLATPGTHGTVWRAKTASEGSFVLNMWIAGARSDGTIPGGGTARAAYERNLGELLRVLKPYHRLVRFTRTLDDGTSRECYGEVIARLEPQHLNKAVARLAIEIAVPGAFWQDTTTVDQQLAVASTPTTLRFTSFAASTAPLTSALIRVLGPVNTPILTSADTNEWLRYDGNIAAGDWIDLDGATYSVTDPPAAYAGLAAVRFSGNYFLELPADSLGPRVTFTGAGIGAGTAVRVIGRRRYLL